MLSRTKEEGLEVLVDPYILQPPKKRGRPTGSGKNQPTAIVGLDLLCFGRVFRNTICFVLLCVCIKVDVEMRITNLENQFDSYKIQKLGRKGIFVGIISKGMQVEVIIIFDDGTKYDALPVSDSEDDDTEADDDTKDDAFTVSDSENDESEADDDTDVI
uniref:Uncharacterized protein n=1 Tax=Tanacetum cinerariifolium TaxID=118510 RepID=A0A6L2JZZ0_TANCI|nr:hypothetical protein [Tanacetum cinerariifolium]